MLPEQEILQTTLQPPLIIQNALFTLFIPLRIALFPCYFDCIHLHGDQMNPSTVIISVLPP